MLYVGGPFYQIISHINYLIDLSQSNTGNERTGIFSVPNRHYQFKKSVDNHRPAEYSYVHAFLISSIQCNTLPFNTIDSKPDWETM